jgi:cobalt-zinc-cadmium efflux system outer membrane protein
MPSRRLLLFSGALLMSGCLWPVHEKTDLAVAELVARPVDLAPETAPRMPPATSAKPPPPLPAADVQTTVFMQAGDPRTRPQFDLRIPPEVPGSEAPLIKYRTKLSKPPTPEELDAREREVYGIYPELSPLPGEPQALPGPSGRPYTLADLQRLAAENSPTLRQAAADVEAAKGNLLQARAYPNPSVGLEQDPSNNGATAGVVGIFVDQVIKTGGKLKLQGAAAEMDLRNAEIALKKARSDLATQVRTAYFGLLIARETVRVSAALARFTDVIYRYQTRLTAGGFGAGHEPAALRAQAYTTRLAYKQAIATYIYAWKQLVAAVGLRQLPLTEVAGRVDQFIPRYEYDAVLAYVVRNHTDVLTARNAVARARYSLQLAQVTPAFPDVEVRAAFLKETALAPFNWVHTLQVGLPLPIWDQNKGNIIAAQAALERAAEEPHRVEVTLANNLATAYTAYKTNLDALEDYRRNILPDLVRYYRGVFERRNITMTADVTIVDVVTAQQTLLSNVTSYLTVLGQFWTSAVNVAALLQTDDLFQLGKPEALPELPDLSDLPPWPCGHPAGSPAHAPAQETPTLPAPRRFEEPEKPAPARVPLVLRTGR